MSYRHCLESLRIYFMVFCCSTLAWSGEAKGYWQENCTQTMFHLEQAANPEWKELTLQMEVRDQLEMSPLPVWQDTSGKRCASPDKCEKATKAGIRFRKITSRSTAGSYRMEFGNGEKEEGTFVMKFRRMKPLPSCD